VFLTLHQRQQHGSEMLPLGLTETVTKQGKVLAQGLLHQVDWEWHDDTSTKEPELQPDSFFGKPHAALLFALSKIAKLVYV
jgi:hypothetical protein